MDAMSIANSPVLWIACAIPVLFVVFQAVLFLIKARKAATNLDIPEEDVKKAIRSAAITSIGPSIVVLSGMLSLLVSVGAPVGWMRLSMIGSVMFESIAAGLGTSSVGVTLGTDTLTGEALAMAVWTMVLCSIGWVLFGTFAANKMDKIEGKLTKGNSGMLMRIASCAIIGVFSAMCASHLIKPVYQLMSDVAQGTIVASWHNCLACVLGAVIMLALNTIAEKKNIAWLREWALTITIVAAMVITALV